MEKVFFYPPNVQKGRQKLEYPWENLFPDQLIGEDSCIYIYIIYIYIYMYVYKIIDGLIKYSCLER